MEGTTSWSLSYFLKFNTIDKYPVQSKPDRRAGDTVRRKGERLSCDLNKETKNLDLTSPDVKLATESDNSAFNKLVKFVTQKPKTENNKK